MRKKYKNAGARAGAFFLVMNMILWLLPVGMVRVKAEGGSYITQITLEKGSLGTLTLEESGYQMIEQSLNPSGGEEIHLGFQTGGEGDAIRDILVSAGGGESLTVDGCYYQKVSDISLNSGAAGGVLRFLYVSRDEKAGEPIRGISFFAKKTKDGFSSEGPVLASDGSEVVTTDKHKAANFDEGIGGSELYLRMYKGNLYRPYVENVVVAEADSEEDAILELAGKRCTYFVNYDIGEDKSVMVGYTRTDDEEKALRALVAIGGKEVESLTIKDVPYTPVEGGRVKADKTYSFYMTTDERAGEPIVDLIACGYDPDEFGLEDMNKEKEEEKDAEEEKESETDDEAGEEPEQNGEGPKEEAKEKEERKEEGKDEEPKEDKKEESEEEPPNEESHEDGGAEDTVSEVGTGIRIPGFLCVVGLNDDAFAASGGSVGSTEGTDEDVRLAKAYRLYSEIEMKDWIAGYFLRGGGQTASKYLYDESDYTSAANSDEKLWISNIYCSGKKGKQFINCIGYVSKSGEGDSDPFEVTLACDEAEDYAKNQGEAESTASVFGMNISQVAMFSMIFVIMAGIIISLGYKLHKNNKDGRKEL